MRRIMLLTLLALALPSAALANSIGFTTGEGYISSHFENPFTVTLYGHRFSPDFLTIETSSITPDGCPSEVCTFSSGSIRSEVRVIVSPGEFIDVFVSSTLFDGKIVHVPSGDGFSLNYITARIRGGMGAPFGGTVKAEFDAKGGHTGFGHVSIDLASKSFPEPSALKDFCLELACSVSQR